MTPKPLMCGVELGGTKCECLVGTAPDDIRERITLKTESDAAASLRHIAGILRGWTGTHRRDSAVLEGQTWHVQRHRGRMLRPVGAAARIAQFRQDRPDAQGRVEE